MLFGVTDDGIVRGIRLHKATRDDFRRSTADSIRTHLVGCSEIHDGTHYTLRFPAVEGGDYLVLIELRVAPRSNYEDEATGEAWLVREGGGRNTEYVLYRKEQSTVQRYPPASGPRIETVAAAMAAARTGRVPVGSPNGMGSPTRGSPGRRKPRSPNAGKHMRKCAGCVVQPRMQFSENQWRKGVGQSRCKACVEKQKQARQLASKRGKPRPGRRRGGRSPPSQPQPEPEPEPEPGAEGRSLYAELFTDGPPALANSGTIYDTVLTDTSLDTSGGFTGAQWNDVDDLDTSGGFDAAPKVPASRPEAGSRVRRPSLYGDLFGYVTTADETGGAGGDAASALREIAEGVPPAAASDAPLLDGGASSSVRIYLPVLVPHDIVSCMWPKARHQSPAPGTARSRPTRSVRACLFALLHRDKDSSSLTARLACVQGALAHQAAPPAAVGANRSQRSRTSQARRFDTSSAAGRLHLPPLMSCVTRLCRRLRSRTRRTL